MTIYASGYARLSKLSGVDNVSLDGMIRDIEQRAFQLGAVMLGPVHVDDGISGAVRDRPEFRAWLEDGRSGAAQILIPYVADRLTREGVNAAGLVLDVVEGKDPDTGKVVRPEVRLTDTKGIDSAGDPDSFRFSFVIAAEIARSELRKITIRNIDTKRRLRYEQRYSGGVAPYGYKTVPHPSGRGKGLEVVPDEALYIKAAAQMIIEGSNVNQVVHWLNDSGSVPRRARAWCQTTVRRLLTSDTVLGRMSHKRRPLRDEDGDCITPWEPILTLDESAQVRGMILAMAQGHRPAQRRGARLLSGFVVCAGCGGKLRLNRNGPDGKYIRYLCVGTSSTRACREGTCITAPLIEDHVASEMLALFGSANYQKPLRSVPTHLAELADVEVRLQEASADMIKPGADVAKFAAEVAKLAAKREELDAMPMETTVRLIDTGQTVAEAWEDLDLTGRREMLKWALAGEIVIKRGQVGRRGLDTSRFTLNWNPALVALGDVAKLGANRKDRALA